MRWCSLAISQHTWVNESIFDSFRISDVAVAALNPRSFDDGKFYAMSCSKHFIIPASNNGTQIPGLYKQSHLQKSTDDGGVHKELQSIAGLGIALINRKSPSSTLSIQLLRMPVKVMISAIWQRLKT